MDNTVMTDEQLNKLVDKLADAMVKRIYGIEQREARATMSYYADDLNDHSVGELARLMTLMDIFKNDEAYEKCALVRNRIVEIKKIIKKYNKK